MICPNNLGVMTNYLISCAVPRFFLTSAVTTGNSAPAPTRPAVVKPLAPALYKIEFTASAELSDKLERLRALMRSSVPDGDLAAIIEEAVSEASSRYIPAPVRRVVCARDRDQCAFVDENGRRFVRGRA
jgi:hypothetical protein